MMSFESPALSVGASSPVYDDEGQYRGYVIRERARDIDGQVVSGWSFRACGTHGAELAGFRTPTDAAAWLLDVDRAGEN